MNKWFGIKGGKQSANAFFGNLLVAFENVFGIDHCQPRLVENASCKIIRMYGNNSTDNGPKKQRRNLRETIAKGGQRLLIPGESWITVIDPNGDEKILEHSIRMLF
jgi:hypothetical protein